MGDEVSAVAAVLDVPTTTEGSTGEMAPQAPGVAQGTAPTAPVTPPAESKAPEKTAEPDIDALLANEDFVKRVLEHKKAQERIKSVRQADIDRVAQERAGEIVRQERQRVEAEAKIQLQRANQERDDADLWRMVEEDPTSPLAQRLRPDLEQRRASRQAQAAEEAAMQRILPEVMPKLHERALTEAGRYWMQVLDSYIAEADGLSDEQRSSLNPRDPQWKTPLEFMQAVHMASAKTIAEKEIERRLPAEVEAKLQERLANSRRQEQSPPVLPAGQGGTSENEFLSSYASGKNNDHGRALKHLRDLGLQV